jgi:DNA-binding transcriptional LysR family regulator
VASALAMHPPSLSQAIRGLERELGIELFHRTGRGLVLTAAGEALVAPARQVLRDATAARAAVAEVVSLRAGRLDIAAHAALTVDPLSPPRRHSRHLGACGTMRLAGVRDGSCRLARRIADAELRLPSRSWAHSRCGRFCRPGPPPPTGRYHCGRSTTPR